jgi:hypothetical protein
MVDQAVEQFLPAGAAGALLAVMLWRFAPEALWMLPGLWQLLVSLGISASARSLPRSVMLGAALYFVAGFVTLMLASQNHALSWPQSCTLLLEISCEINTGDAPFSSDSVRSFTRRPGSVCSTSLIAHPGTVASISSSSAVSPTAAQPAPQCCRRRVWWRSPSAAGASRPHTSCRLPKNGRRRFLDYLAVLERLVRDAAKAGGKEDAPAARLGILRA